MNTYLLIHRVVVKQKDFQKDPRKQLLKQKSDQQWKSAVRMRKRPKLQIITVVLDVV